MRRPMWDVPCVSEEDAKKDPFPKEARVVIPTGSEAERIWQDAKNNKVCGLCRHSRLKEGQQQFKDQKLFEDLFDSLSVGHNKDWYGRLDMFAIFAGLGWGRGEQPRDCHPEECGPQRGPRDVRIS